jgi:hypothetical protein
MAKIIHTDNFGGDYPDEKFVTGLPVMNKEQADLICAAINTVAHHGCGDIGGARHYRVVDNGYELKPGFEP